ncbi:MAG: hypothetical protein KJI71_00275 [Patescibacteria group bacterium]|nr:hypothetical protein [Patescibacteria group bacterium]
MSPHLSSLLENMTAFIVIQSYVNYTIKEEFESNINDATSKKGEYRDLIEKIFPKAGIDNYNRFLNYQCRNAIQTIHTELENYLFKCFRDIIIKYPRHIEEKQVKIKTLINFGLNTKKVIEYKVEKYLNELLNKPYKEIFNFSNIKFGLKFKIDEIDLEVLFKFKQIRNLYAHQNGIVDKTFLNKLKDLGYKEGDVVDLTLDKINDYSQVVHNIAIQFDNCFINKYPEFAI